MNHLPTLSLIQSRSARIDLARERFFEEGIAPTGMVGAAVFESWARCLRLHANPREPAVFQPVTASRTQLSLLKSRHMHEAWMAELPRLEAVLSASNCAAMLTDAAGILIGASCVGRSHEALMPVATRIGVNLSEDAVGTTAPGVVARTGKAVCVIGGEHFFDSVKEMYCAAAPIRDIEGRLAGVLDVSSEQAPFEFDAAAVAGLYAGAIENRLLVAQSTQHLVIRFQVAPDLLDSAMVGLVGIDSEGKVAWENGVAHSLLGAAGLSQYRGERTPEGRLGHPWVQLAALPAAGAAPLTLANGLTVWARASMRARDGRRGIVSTSRPMATQSATDPTPDPRSPFAPPPSGPQRTEIAAPHPVEEVEGKPAVLSLPRLRDADYELIERTLQACDGNVSRAAERLGVSRGLIYRRLRAAATRDEAPAG